MKNPIELTEKAKKYLLDSCVSANKSAIKLQVKGGGCAGFSYQYSFEDTVNEFDEIINLDEQHKFVLDSLSLMYVLGTVVDYEEKLGSSSLVIKNPNESSSCGCGKSFSVG
jgi:iron-sulfur cluster insertion protein